MERWLEGRVAGQKRWNQRLLSLRIEADVGSYQAGQFVKLALDVDGERVARPYSFVNAPGEQPLEFYYNIVAEGPLTPRLAALRAGDPVFVANNPSGFLVLSEVPPAEQLWMIATGTGLAPFLSILWADMIIFGACMALAVYFSQAAGVSPPPGFHGQLPAHASCLRPI